MREDLGVARVGCLTTEDVRRPVRPPEDLVHERELHLAEALAAEIRAEVAGPEAALLDLRLERRGDLLVLLVLPIERCGRLAKRQVEGPAPASLHTLPSRAPSPHSTPS